jgi:transposase
MGLEPQVEDSQKEAVSLVPMGASRCKKHPSLLFHQMVKCAGMIERHLGGILAHWRNKTTNAFLEALNSVFSAVKRKARGFRSTDNLIAMLYLTAGKLRIPATH